MRDVGDTTFTREEAATDYDQVVNWEQRLGRETPFFRDLFDRTDVRSVVDVGCGTGKHAIVFASWGLEVVGVDPSEAMLVQARRNADAAGVRVRWVSGGYGDLAGLVDGPVDAVVSLGNALMHVEGPAGAAIAVTDMASLLRPGGVLVLHFLNQDRLLAHRPRMLPARFRETPEGDKVFVRLLDYEDDAVVFEFVTLTRTEDGGWEVSSRVSRHAPLPVRSVLDALGGARFHDVKTLGSHEGKAFDVDEDESVIVVGYRG